MEWNKIMLVVGAILMISGLVFTFLPHNIHNIILGDVAEEGHSHAEYNTRGLIIALIGLAVAGIGRLKAKV